MEIEVIIAVLTVVLSFIADIIAKYKSTTATIETNKKLGEAVDRLVVTVENHGARIERLENTWSSTSSQEQL